MRNKRLPEAQRTQGIESKTSVISAAINKYKYNPVKKMIQVIAYYPVSVVPLAMFDSQHWYDQQICAHHRQKCDHLKQKCNQQICDHREEKCQLRSVKQGSDSFPSCLPCQPYQLPHLFEGGQ